VDRRDRTIATAILIACSVAVACSSAEDDGAAVAATDDAVIVVGAFDFAESALLGEVYSQTLEAGGYEVERAFDLGPRELVVPALETGLVELVPEYAGTALTFLSLGEALPARDSEATHAALERVLEGGPLVALAAAPAQNANTFVVRRDVAEREGLQTLSDLAAAAPDLIFGGPPECATRPLCLAGLERVYGVEFGTVLRLDAGGPVTHQALRIGQIDVALLFTTDPAVGDAAYVELADDRGLQPAENVTPLARRDVVDMIGPELIERIDAVSRALTTAELRDLNARADAAGSDPAGVARAWIEEQGLR
jgi:osmoprotectant transport system substrate-binding protein